MERHQSSPRGCSECVQLWGVASANDIADDSSVAEEVQSAGCDEEAENSKVVGQHGAPRRWIERPLSWGRSLFCFRPRRRRSTRRGNLPVFGPSAATMTTAVYPGFVS